ncbi:hypothetical protein [Mycobacteroides abscessus]|uniref:hypothetical protein n=1 Tax=Mycobacteroides abscessus TaxID=36809 RepID=UPI000C25B016|nr:hypothetical protein [Mycobacteroides abscessus]
MDITEKPLTNLADTIHTALIGHAPADYACYYKQLFNVFGAPGIPNTYEAVLKRYGRVIHRETFWRRKSAEKQCIAWKRLYDAVVLPPPQS